MKKLTTFVLLVLVCLTAQGQTPNAQFRQLEDYLYRKGFNVRLSQYNGGDGLSRQWYVHISADRIKLQLGMRIGGNEDAYARQLLIDSINALRQQELMEVLDSIRHAFARVSKDATESYLYEAHQNGVDTIKYSLGMKAKDSSALVFSGEDNRGERFYVDPSEFMDFRYSSKAPVANNREWGFGVLSHMFKYTSGLPWDDLKDFDRVAFEQLIQPVLKRAMKLKGAKEYPVYWRYDKGFDDNVGGGGLLRKQVGLNNEGLTTGIDYVIPFPRYGDAAHALLRELDSLSHGYVDAHPEQRYLYNFPSRFFPDPEIGQAILTGYSLGHDANYVLMYGLESDGFLHILSICTDGELWMPLDWYKLKSYINGERVYRKK